ncbi:MAG: YraN family protein [Candidatus Margulisiibacteriota bacterium]
MGLESYLLGKDGEKLAESYLTSRGYSIIETNFHSQQGEIDIVAEESGCLVFVEVKSYSYRSYSLPVFAVKKSKKENIIHAARYYLYKKKIRGKRCRFDVIAIYKNSKNETVIELFKNAFGVK